MAQTKRRIASSNGSFCPTPIQKRTVSDRARHGSILDMMAISASDAIKSVDIVFGHLLKSSNFAQCRRRLDAISRKICLTRNQPGNTRDDTAITFCFVRIREVDRLEGQGFQLISTDIVV